MCSQASASNLCPFAFGFLEKVLGSFGGRMSLRGYSGTRAGAFLLVGKELELRGNGTI